MFRVHRVGSNSLSVKNLVLLFFTILLGFASVITLAQITIPSTIDNARQTIGRVTITEDGTDITPTQMDISSGGIYINSGILAPQGSFSGMVLGIDDYGNLIYVYSQNLVVSGAGGVGGTGDGLWTGNGNDIWNINTTGSVGIGAMPTTGRLYVTSNTEPELVLEETNSSNAANIHLKNTTNTWMLGGYSDRFYIGNNNSAFLNIITGGNVGIGTTTPKAPLQVVGNFIAGNYNNNALGSNSSVGGGDSNTVSGNVSFIGGGGNNTITGYASFIGGGGVNTLNGVGYNTIAGGQYGTIIGQYGFIGGGYTNRINGDASSLAGGRNNTITGSYSFLGGGNANQLNGDNGFIGGGDSNIVDGGQYSSVVGGFQNKIYTAQEAAIVGGKNNTITGVSDFSLIPGGQNNTISGAVNSFAGGYKAKSYHDNTFVRNSDTNVTTGFFSTDIKQFLINAPYKAGAGGGVGINVNDPQAQLDVNGLIRVREASALIIPTNCSGSNDEGKIGFDGTHFQGCNGTGRVQLD